jgi:hypothetical protein
MNPGQTSAQRSRPGSGALGLGLPLLLWLGLPSSAWAGMPSIHLTEVGSLRLETISFFLMLFLGSSALIMFLWNRLRRDFPSMPRLGYGPALGLVGLWGLLFLLVLTMISGARELLTPGAWKKDGLTYKLATSEQPPPAPPTIDAMDRWSKLDALRLALWQYAETHDHQFPPSATGPEPAADLWLLPGVTGARYLYRPGLKPNEGRRLLAFEPEVFEGKRWVLFSSGELRRLTSDEIAASDTPEKQP